jgi:hypothetical protein
MSDVDIYVEARDWIADCAWNNLELDQIEELSDEQVRRGIERHYGGGWAAFSEACGIEAVETTERPLSRGPRRRPSSLADHALASTAI